MKDLMGHCDGGGKVTRVSRHGLAGSDTSLSSTPGSEAAPIPKNRKLGWRVLKAGTGRRGGGEHSRQVGPLSRGVEREVRAPSPTRPAPQWVTSCFGRSPSTPWSCFFWFQVSHIWDSFS